jgi:hypothetical protein
MIADLKKDEAKFISSVAAYRRGMSELSDAEYEALKNKLVKVNWANLLYIYIYIYITIFLMIHFKEKSWVVMRSPDPLEKLGIETFMGYLHREQNYSSDDKYNF